MQEPDVSQILESARSKKAPPVRFRLVRGALGIITVALLTVTLGSFAGTLGHSFELISHFKLQYLVLSSVALLACLAIREKRWGWVAWTAVVLNAAVIAPWYLGKQEIPANSGTADLKIILSNVLTSNPDAQPLLKLVQQEQPDIVLLQEVNQRWMDDLAPLAAQYPYSEIISREDNFGIALLSRLPLRNARNVELGTYNFPSILAEVNLGNRFISVLTAHPFPPGSAVSLAGRNEQLASIGPIVQQQKNPVILMGDLNLSMWSPYYSKLVADTGLKNARKGFGVLPTWPADSPVMQVPIDHCLVSSEIGVRNIKRGPNIGSDHYPLVVTLAVPGKR